MLLARLQILADGEDVHAPTALVAHHGFDLVHLFAEAHHDAGLGQHVGVEFLGVRESRRRPIVIVLRLDLLEQSRHGLHVVVQDFGPRIHHDLQCFERAFEIGDQHFNRTPRQQFSNPPDYHCEYRRSTIAPLVPIYRCNDRVLQLHGFDGLRHALGFAPIHERGLAVFDVAESARARAHVAEHQKGRGAAPPAFAEVWAHGFLADRVQFLFAHQSVEPFVGLARGRAHLDPLGAAQRTDVGFGDDSVSRRRGRHKSSREPSRRSNLQVE